MAITDWPAAERPREKLLAKGAAALSDAELLAIFLRTGLPGVSAVDLARQLLSDFGGLRPLLEAERKAFCAGKGLGDAKFVQLQAVRDYLSAQLRHRTREVFCCLFLDSQHRVIAFDELFEGTLNAASVYPREVVQAALARGAAAVILAHNHPSGVSEPSQADIHITGRLKDALALVDVRVLDHLIVGEGAGCSFAERGLL
ncbi:JAB domain-containing protein [Microbulbifer agarilyticus]